MCNNSSFFFMMVYSIAAIKYSQECTNHDAHVKYGSGQPVNRALWHYSILPAIYNVYDAILQAHGKIHNLLFFFFASISVKPTECLPNLLATKPRQIDLPERLAKIIRRNNLLNLSVTPAHGFNLPELGVIPTRGIDLPEKTPLPAQNPQARPGPRSPPLPLIGSA